MPRFPTAGIRWYQLHGVLHFGTEPLPERAETALAALKGACEGRLLLGDPAPGTRSVSLSCTLLPEQITRIRKTLPPLLRVITQACELEESNAGFTRWILLEPGARELNSSKLPAGLRLPVSEQRVSI